jgi:hypothetical protein
LRIAREGIREPLDGDFAIQLGVAGQIRLAHPTCAQRGEDFVRSDFGAGRRHWKRIILSL